MAGLALLTESRTVSVDEISSSTGHGENLVSLYINSSDECYVQYFLSPMEYLWSSMRSNPTSTITRGYQSSNSIMVMAIY